MLVANFILRVELLIEGQASGLQGAGVGHQHGILEVGNNFVFLFFHHGVGGQQFVFQAFLYTDLGGNFVFEAALREAQYGELRDHVIEECAGSLGLQHIGAVDITLVDSATHVTLFGLAFSGGDIDIQDEDVVHLEFVVLNILVISGLVDNGVVTIQEELGHIVGEDTFHSVDVVSITAFLNDFGDFMVIFARLQETEASLDGVMGSKDDFGLLAVNFLLADHDSVSHLTDETVNVDAEVDLDEVALVDGKVLGNERRHVANEVVGGDTGREGDTFLHLFVFGENLLDFLLDEVVTESTDG
jgi:hypothetical protein